MSFKNRVGTFFILAGAILLFVFATSIFTPNGHYEVMALLAGLLLAGLGLNWRLSKAKGGPPGAGPGPRPGAPAGGAKPAAAPPRPAPGAAKKPGRLAMLMKGPPNKKTAPAPPKPAQGPLNPARKAGKRK